MNPSRPIQTLFACLLVLVFVPTAIAQQSKKFSGIETAPQREEKSVEYWVDQLGHDHYLRREKATEKLLDAGSVAIDPLVDAIRKGDLEVIERSTEILTSIALSRPPNNDGGAWESLQRLAEQTAGLRSSSARNALEEIRQHRSQQSHQALADAGITVGFDEFAIGAAISRPLMVVQIDDNWEGDVDALQWLRWLSGVQHARIAGPALQPEVIEAISQMPELETLALVEGKISHDALIPLTKMKRMDTVEFRYIPLSEKHAKWIAKIPMRSSLSLMGTGLKDDTVEQLKQDLTGLKIEFRQGGFMGVMCNDIPSECKITGIVPGGAAEQAGLIPEDVIVGIDDTEVNKFRDLQNAINQRLPGDEVTVEYRRGGTLRTIKLRLKRLEEK